jgi:hypothetical protein
MIVVALLRLSAAKADLNRSESSWKIADQQGSDFLLVV